MSNDDTIRGLPGAEEITLTVDLSLNDRLGILELAADPGRISSVWDNVWTRMDSQLLKNMVNEGLLTVSFDEHILKGTCCEPYNISIPGDTQHEITELGRQYLAKNAPPFGEW